MNSTTTGMATPYVLPSKRYMPEPISLPGRPIVVNEVVLVSVVPSGAVAVTLAVYVVSYFSGVAGTQVEASSRSSPLTDDLAPSAVSFTSVTSPPLMDVPISVLTGSRLAPAFGVIARLSGSAAGPGVALGAAPLPFGVVSLLKRGVSAPPQPARMIVNAAAATAAVILIRPISSPFRSPLSNIVHHTRHWCTPIGQGARSDVVDASATRTAWRRDLVGSARSGHVKVSVVVSERR